MISDAGRLHAGINVNKSSRVQHAAGGAALRISVIFADPIYARGLQASLAELPDVSSVEYAVAVADAVSDGDVDSADVVVLDSELPGVGELAHELACCSSARVLLCVRAGSRDDLTSVIGDASGVLAAEALTPEVMAAAIRAISHGVGVLGIDLLRDLLYGVQTAPPAPPIAGGRETERLTSREHAVLSLVAEGVPSREIANRLAYSERTIKNILHDVITKLGARSRSHAVAVAVRERII
jgi:DNA-binding NarL/FixJ family response regulator